MIIEKLIKCATNKVGYITIPAFLIGLTITIILEEGVTKKKVNSSRLYFKKEKIGKKCFIEF